MFRLLLCPHGLQENCMRRSPVVICMFLTLVSMSHGHAQPAPPGTSNGTIVDQHPCAPVPGTYENYVDVGKKGYATEYEAARRAAPCPDAARGSVSCNPCTPARNLQSARQHQGFECVRITYLSDELKVVGHIFSNRRPPMVSSNPPPLSLIVAATGNSAKTRRGVSSVSTSFLA